MKILLFYTSVSRKEFIIGVGCINVHAGTSLFYWSIVDNLTHSSLSHTVFVKENFSNEVTYGIAFKSLLAWYIIDKVSTKKHDL